MFSSAELHARTSASPGSELESEESVEGSPLTSYDWLKAYGLVGSSGKTSPVSCRRTEDGRWELLSGGWRNSGMGSPGECWTLSMSEWTDTLVPSPSDAGVSSLSDILVETRDVPQRFYLSRRACEGILRLAEKRGKVLPPLLLEALRFVETNAQRK
jgi:hypothetical protein